MRAAKFPVTKTLDTFEFKAQPSINEELLRELLQSDYIDKRENRQSPHGKNPTGLRPGLHRLPARTQGPFLHRNRFNHATARTARGERAGTIS